MSLGNREDVGRRIGVFQTVMAVGALAGAPISGAIYDRTQEYTAVGAYAGESADFSTLIRPSSLRNDLTPRLSALVGAMVLISVVLMVLTRHLMLGRLWGKC